MSRRRASASAAESSGEWVVDSVIGFLRGPVWNVPVLTFIEHKSIVFEPEGDDNEEEYHKIHAEYKGLVDFMLGSLMSDLGITSGQFEAACADASARMSPQLQNMLFEQVWAAEDYGIFRRLMIHKNIELQLQALELLQKRYGVLPSSLRPGADDPAVAEDPAEAKSEEGGDGEVAHVEDKVMQEVVKKTLAEHEATVTALDADEKQQEAEAVAHSEDDQRRLQAMADHFKKINIGGEAEAEAAPPAPDATLDADELRRRSEFLKAQRDKLLAMKKEERQKQLLAAESRVESRPKSARAARVVLDGGKAASGVDEQQLRVRRALAEKLKQEVIGNN